MPCYTIRVVTVEFTAKSIENLREALEKEGYIVEQDGSILYAGKFTFNLDQKTVKYTGSNYLPEKKINAIKRSYTFVTLSKEMKKKKWIMRQNQQGKLAGVVVKY
jgi:hypothetical protein